MMRLSRPMLLRSTAPRLAASGSGGFYARSIGAFGVAFVPSGTTAVVERFGRFTGTAAPGLKFYVPVVERVRVVSNRVEQASYQFEIKTKDNIFAHLEVAVQLEVKPEDSERALYTMANPAAQIHALLDAELRAQASSRNLDDIFTEKEEMSSSVFTRAKSGEATVAEMAKAAGFTVHRVLIRGVEPVRRVKDAMNEINAALRMREAKKHEADAQYIVSVREAEADRDRKRLMGEGISQQRLAIMKGYQDGIENMSRSFGLSPKDVVDFVLKTQHLDTVEAIGKSQNCKTLFMNHDPRSVGLEAGHGAKGAGGESVAASAAAIMMANEATAAPIAPRE